VLAIAECLADDGAQLVSRVISRGFRDRDIEVSECLAAATKPEEGLCPAEARTVPIRPGGEDAAQVFDGQAGLREGQSEKAALKSGVRVLRRFLDKAVVRWHCGGEIARFLVRFAKKP
jgi:hypothetical protein